MQFLRHKRLLQCNVYPFYFRKIKDDNSVLAFLLLSSLRETLRLLVIFITSRETIYCS